MSAFSRMLDGQDTRTEAHLVLASLSVVVALALAGWTVIKHGIAFDVQAYGVGMGALFGGIGAASWGRGKEIKDAREGAEK